MYLYIDGSDRISAFQNFNIYDLLRFKRILIFSIYFASKVYGYPKILDRIKTNNESN